MHTKRKHEERTLVRRRRRRQDNINLYIKATVYEDVGGST
jgi:hypothetical protein